jgi:hypothetical protein
VIQTEWIGKVAAMVIARIVRKPVRLGIEEDLKVVSNMVQYGLILSRRYKDLQY